VLRVDFSNNLGIFPFSSPHKFTQPLNMSSDAPVPSTIVFTFTQSADWSHTLPGKIPDDGMCHAYPLTLPYSPRFDHLRGEEEIFLHAQVGDHVPKDTQEAKAGGKRPRPAQGNAHVTIRYTTPILAMEKEIMFERQEEHEQRQLQVETAYAEAFQKRAELEINKDTPTDDIMAAGLEMWRLTLGRNTLRAVRRLEYELKQETKWFLVEAGVPCLLEGVPGKPRVLFGCEGWATKAEQKVLFPHKEEAKVITKSTPVRPERLDFQAIGHGVLAAAFCADGEWIVSGDADYTVRLWDSASGKVLRELKGHSDWVRAVAFSPDGKQVVSGGRDQTVRVWDSASGVELKKLTPPRDRVASVAFLPDGKHVLSAGSGGTVLRWDLETGEIDLEFNTNFYQIYVMALSNCATKLITGSHGRVTIFETETGMVVADLKSHHGQCNAVYLPGDGKHAISGGDDGVLRRSNIATKNVVWEVKTEQSYNAMAVSGDGAFIVVGDTAGRVHFRDAQTGRFLYAMRVKGRVMSLVFSPAGHHLLVATQHPLSESLGVFIHLWTMTPFLDELR